MTRRRILKQQDSFPRVAGVDPEPLTDFLQWCADHDYQPPDEDSLNQYASEVGLSPEDYDHISNFLDYFADFQFKEGAELPVDIEKYETAASGPQCSYFAFPKGTRTLSDSAGHLLYHHNNDPDNPLLSIEMIFANPKYRGHGVAKALLQELVNDHPGHKIDPGILTSYGHGMTNHLLEEFPEAKDLVLPEDPTSAPAVPPWKAASIYDEMVDKAHNEGGFSINPDTGQSPTKGYMVSITPQETQTDVTPEYFKDFHKRHKPDFEGHPENDLGEWHNPEDNLYYTDVSKNERDLWPAVDTALDKDQLAIYDLEHGWDLDTRDEGYNPLLALNPVMASRDKRLASGGDDYWQSLVTDDVDELNSRINTLLSDGRRDEAALLWEASGVPIEQLQRGREVEDWYENWIYEGPTGSYQRHFPRRFPHRQVDALDDDDDEYEQDDDDDDFYRNFDQYMDQSSPPAPSGPPPDPNAKLKSPWSKHIVHYTHDNQPPQFDRGWRSYQDFDFSPWTDTLGRNQGMYQINHPGQQPLKGPPVGYLRYTVEPAQPENSWSYARPPSVHVDLLETHPHYRLHGVGTALMNALAEDYPEHKIDPGFTTEHGTGFVNYMRQHAPGASERLDTSNWDPTPANYVTQDQMKDWGVKDKKSPVFANRQSIDPTIIPSLDEETLHWLQEISAPYHFVNHEDSQLHDLVNRELDHRMRIRGPLVANILDHLTFWEGGGNVPRAPHTWDYDEQTDTYTHPDGSVIAPSDEPLYQGMHQLWWPAVSMHPNSTNKAKIKRPTTDIQALMDYTERTGRVQ